MGEFSKEQSIRKWIWGGCADYARALQEAAFDDEGVELRLGRHIERFSPGGPSQEVHLEEGYVIHHIFAHDDTHAYDALGAHPLPYKHEGWLDEYDIPELDFADEWPSRQEDIDEAYAHALETLQMRE